MITMGWRLACRTAILGLTVMVAASVHALTAAQDLLEKMSLSARTLSYKGYFTYERGQQSSSYQIVHWADKESERQRLVFLDGPEFEIINDGHSLKCLHSGDVPAHQHMPQQVDLSPVEAAGDALDAIWQNYNINVAGSARVAGRQATRVELSPRDHHRYPFVFFVDDETGLMLKMVVLNIQGQPLERFHYVMVDYGHVSEQDLIPQISNVVEMEHSLPAADNDAEPANTWHVVWIPNGFKQEKSKMRTWAPQLPGQQVYMYSDGLSAFSVFVEPANADVKNDTSTQTGSTSAVSHYRQFNNQMFLVTVVGEIPIMTARQIALSVEPAS